MQHEPTIKATADTGLPCAHLPGANVQGTSHLPCARTCLQRVPETTHLWLVPLSKGSAYPGGTHTQNSETGLDIFTRPRTPPACRPAASAEMPTWHSAPEEMLRAVGRKQKRPVFRGLSSERERSGEMGLKAGDSCRAASQRDSAVVRLCPLIMNVARRV